MKRASSAIPFLLIGGLCLVPAGLPDPGVLDGAAPNARGPLRQFLVESQVGGIGMVEHPPNVWILVRCLAQLRLDGPTEGEPLQVSPGLA